MRTTLLLVVALWVVSGFKAPSKTEDAYILHPNRMNEDLRQVSYAVRGELVIRAMEISNELEDGSHNRTYDEVIFSNIGNPQALGQKPLTFLSQVLAIMNYPKLLEDEYDLPADAKQRARTLLSNMKGGLGAYSQSKGVAYIRERVADFIQERDGFPADFENIFLTDGASAGIKAIINLLIRNANDGIMVPIPQYPLYSASITGAGGALIKYLLNEQDEWSLNLESARNSLKEARKNGIQVRAMVVINPGNPTGQCLTESNMRDIIDFCLDHNLVLLADEVYQTNIYHEDRPFSSFKKVVNQMIQEEYSAAQEKGIHIYAGDVPAAHLELFSFHSTSKGLLGECGRRGGYMEAFQIHPEMIEQLYKYQSVSLCSNTVGQVVVELMVNPPKEGDESYPLYKQETEAILGSLQRRARKLVAGLNALEGVSCQPSRGAMYAFPRISIPSKGVKAAQIMGKTPDAFYALSLLEHAGICVVPGAGFKGEGPHDEYHFRTTFLPTEDKMDDFIARLESFHTHFMNEYGADDDDNNNHSNNDRNDGAHDEL